MPKLLLKNGLLINRGKKEYKDILIVDMFIERIDNNISDKNCKIIDAEGYWIIPGIIDDQVHFREPGNTHKADIASESKAALLGGVTSYMEMPNTSPAAVTIELLEQKYDIAAVKSMGNYSFYLGATNNNIKEIVKVNPKKICGIKAFMGSSTGDLLVDDLNALDTLFKRAPILIATHCEDEQTILRNLERYKSRYGKSLNANHHPLIRSAEGCYLSSSLAVSLAMKYNTRLHILHITTSKELDLFVNDIPLKNKRITSEVCVHHLYFNNKDYDLLGNKIKCNPAIKTKRDQDALFKAMIEDKLDIIATDHAPHTLEEKSQDYIHAPSGLPLVQHSLQIMLDFFQKGAISLEDIVRKMCHAPADCFEIDQRGYIDEGCYADLVFIDPLAKVKISKENISYKCGWSPLEDITFTGCADKVIVNGELMVEDGRIINNMPGMRLEFNRDK